jgi:hypothetical protein
MDDWPLDLRTKTEHVHVMFLLKEATMLKIFVEEAVALASITLFVGMIAVWAQILPQL